jgi:hypothetical protein
MLENLGPVQMVAQRLALLYPDSESLRRVLALAQVDATRIPFDHRAANMSWFAAVEAARQGRLAALVGVMLEEYALDSWLVALYANLES